MLKDLVKQCRSYRRFYQDTAIPYNELADMVDTARLAASASNAQALKFKILCTPEECADIFPYIAWAGALKDWDGPEEGERPSAYIVIAVTWLSEKTSSGMTESRPRPSCWLPRKRDTADV